MKANHKRQWKKLRAEVIEADGGRCIRCGKTSADGATFHVHHKAYIDGRAYWDYPLAMLETLCAGCHAKEHGIISPDCGWTLVGDVDLGSRVGTCDYCGTSMRYVFTVSHPNWPTIDVGQDCCNELTKTDEADERLRSIKTRADRRGRFVGFADWAIDEDGTCSTRFLGRIRVVLKPENGAWRIHVGGRRLKPPRETLTEAKGVAFDFIESGEYRKHAP